MQRLESAGAGLLQDAPKHVEPEVVRRKSVFRHGEVDRHEARPRAAQPVEQPALMGERLPQCVRQCGMRLVFRPARIGIGGRMPRAREIEAVQAGLRHDDRPLGMAAARLLQHAQHHVLNRVRHLHYDQQEV